MTQRAAAREPIDTTAEVETPEHVRFHYNIAGPARRAVAYFIDLLLRLAIFLVLALVGVAAGIAGSDALTRASSGFLLLVAFVLEWGYYVFFETLWSGRTPGKRLLSLRVVTEGGHPLSFADSLLRSLLRGADLLPPVVLGLGSYAVGLAVMGRDARFRRLGDLVAGTIVIVEERHVVAGPLRLDPPPTPAELRAIPTRLPLSGEDLDAIELFLRRSGKLSRAREAELAEMVAPLYARRLGVRYRDAVRFLWLLHHRAHEHEKRAA
jgi:uncharacterized RDD family membrane protein YckC